MNRIAKVWLGLCIGLSACGDGGAGDREDGAAALPLSLTGSLQNPAFSPDNRSLLLTLFRGGYNLGPADLLVADPDTGQTRVLVQDGSDNVNLPGSAWTGHTVVFSSSRGEHDEIYIIADSGAPGDEQAVTARSADAAYEPTESPDGEWIVFESHVAEVEGGGVITKRRRDGTGDYTALTAAGEDCRQPNWSPKGEWITFQKLVGGHWEIWVVKPDGTGARQITSGPGDKTDPSFSPDGQWILHSFAEDDASETSRIQAAPLAGGAAVEITDADAYDGAPTWSPDGKWIAFESAPTSPEDGEAGTALWRIPAPSL